jgi:hypothetical protein
MTEIEYVYTRSKKTKKQNKKLESIIFLIILVITAYFLFFKDIDWSSQNKPANVTINKTFVYENETYQIITVPPEYKKAAGLDYIRNNSAAEIEKAKSLCTDMLGGNWVDTENAMGCYNMKYFVTAFCDRDIIKTLMSLCEEINGNSECLADRIVCSV